MISLEFELLMLFRPSALCIKEVEALKSLTSSGESQAVVLFDLTQSAYLAEFDIQSMMQIVKILESLATEKRAHVFLALRHDLLSNEFFYHVPRVLAVQPDSLNVGSEEQFSRTTKNYSVLFMYKASSSKLEIEDRLQFSLSSGFSFKPDASQAQSKSSTPPSPVHDMSNSTEAMILVEDSDRDSEGEMEADADF